MKRRRPRRFRRRRQEAQRRSERGLSPLSTIPGLLSFIQCFHDARIPYQRLDAMDEALRAAAQIQRDSVARPLTRAEACEQMGLDFELLAELSSPDLTYPRACDINEQLKIDRVTRRGVNPKARMQAAFRSFQAHTAEQLRSTGELSGLMLAGRIAGAQLVYIDDPQTEELQDSLNVPASLLEKCEGFSYAAGRVAFSQFTSQPFPISRSVTNSDLKVEDNDQFQS